MAYESGEAAPSGVVVNAVAQGLNGRAVFVSATSPSGSPDPYIDSVQATVTGASARITVKPKAGLSHGIYKGTLVLNACADAACAVHYAGSPWSISYTLTVTLPYSKLDTRAFGTARTLVYDAVRGDIYASYPTYEMIGLSAVARFRWTGSAWTASTLSIPGLKDIALPPDASVLAATDGNNTVHLIDLTTFTIKSSHVSPAGIADQGTRTETGIAFTADGKLWTSIGGNVYFPGGVGYFDLQTLKFGVASPPCPSCYGSQFFAVSGDGSRLMLTQSASVSPAPPMLYLDTAEGFFRTNPIGLEFFYYGTSLSYNGDRFLMNGYTVYDRQFGTVGTIPQLPTGFRGVQMSPDGRRAYAVTFDFEASPSPLWGVQVFDTSAPAGTHVVVPLVGSFTIPDRPSCRPQNELSFACLHPVVRVTSDGNNLLILGEDNLVVVPIPNALSGLATSSTGVQQ